MLSSVSRYLGVGLALLQLAHAVPSSLATRSTTEYVANFEDIKAIDPALSTQPIGVYKEVLFQAFSLVSGGSTGLIKALPVVGGSTGEVTSTVPNIQTGVLLHSPPNAATFTDVTDTLQGPPSLRTVYPGSSSTTKRLKLISFWWGVAVNLQENLASVPQNAQLTVTGYKTADDSVTQTFDYDLTAVIQDMKLAELKSEFNNLTHVDFSVSTIAAGDAMKTIFDDVKIVVSQ